MTDALILNLLVAAVRTVAPGAEAEHPRAGGPVVRGVTGDGIVVRVDLGDDEHTLSLHVPGTPSVRSPEVFYVATAAEVRDVLPGAVADVRRARRAEQTLCHEVCADSGPYHG